MDDCWHNGVVDISVSMSTSRDDDDIDDNVDGVAMTSSSST